MATRECGDRLSPRRSLRACGGRPRCPAHVGRTLTAATGACAGSGWGRPHPLRSVCGQSRTACGRSVCPGAGPIPVVICCAQGRTDPFRSLSIHSHDHAPRGPKNALALPARAWRSPKFDRLRRADRSGKYAARMASFQACAATPGRLPWSAPLPSARTAIAGYTACPIWNATRSRS